MSREYEMSWEEYIKLCYQLCEKIEKEKNKFDNIVCIARGGLIVGRVLCDFFGLPLHIVYTKRYKKGTQKTNNNIIMSKIIGTEKLNGNIIVVDDITDVGITMAETVKKLENIQDIKKIKSAVIVHKPHSVFKPDYYVKLTKRWVVFPYERTEYKKSKF